MTVPLPREGTYYGLFHFHNILSRHCETSQRFVGSSSDDGCLGLRNMRGEWRMVRYRKLVTELPAPLVSAPGPGLSVELCLLLDGL